MLTVACCWWGWYPLEYVARLQRAVAANLTIPHRFVCLTNRTAPCETLPLVENLPGNMPLMNLFRPGNGLTGRVLALDLDSLITGSLDDIASYNGRFAVVADFNTGKVDGFMRSFVAGEHAYLWENASAAYHMEIPFFHAHLRGPDLWQDIVPGQVVSFKRHCRGGLPKGARIVSFHGKPKMHECAGWVTRYWTMHDE